MSCYASLVSFRDTGLRQDEWKARSQRRKTKRVHSSSHDCGELSFVSTRAHVGIERKRLNELLRAVSHRLQCAQTRVCIKPVNTDALAGSACLSLSPFLSVVKINLIHSLTPSIFLSLSFLLRGYA